MESVNIFTDKQICIIGTGGFAREVYCCLEDIFKYKGVSFDNKAVFSDVDSCENDVVVMGQKRIPIIKESKLDVYKYVLFVAIGDSMLRKKVVEKYPNDVQYATIIHPTAVISDYATIGEGSIVTANCVVTCNINIGKQCHLNLNTTIGHDCEIGDYFTTAPGVHISGICNIGDRVYFGTNACVKQGINICDDVIVGMGSVVVKDINESGIAYGNPCKIVSNVKFMGGVNNKSVIIGAGTYGEVYLSYLQECGIEVVAFMDNNPTLVGTYIKGIRVVGSEDLLETEEWKHKVSNVYCPIGNNPLRRKILSRVKELGYNTPYFIHPSACIADNVSIAEGVYVLPQTVIMPFTKIDKYCMISMNAKIAHHSILEEGCFISTGVNFGANIHALKDAYMGIGSLIMTGVKIVGENSLIGAGSIVIRDVPDNAVMVGNPAKVLKYKE
jgi:sugar O-acyltransferase (sialic acid O-acetyltransferase NeuD family)